jgi:tetratricopeptide (TPR) repeat protein
MEPDQIHSALLRLLSRAREAQAAWAAGLPDAERAAVGTPERWTPKDELAHMTFWQQITAERLAVARAGGQPTDTSDFQALNDRTFAEQRDTPWAQVLASAEQAYATLAERVRALDGALLTDSGRFEWTRGQPLTASVLGNGFWHPLEHIARFYHARGEPGRAAELLEGAVLGEPALATLPNDHGAALYNLACFYTTTGQPERALPLLPEALRLRPDLVEWSKQDTDLDVLRDHPAFQALHQA